MWLKVGAMLMMLSCLLLQAQSPNFVFILVDDMSWVGSSAEMIEGDEQTKSDFYLTPHIDKLAAQGMRFSQAYAPAALCTPSRASILTGKTPAELHMTTPGRGGRSQSYQKLGSPRVVTDLPVSELTVAEVLKEQGYTTAHLGKWHLGVSGPGVHGFDVHDGPTENEMGGGGEDPKGIFSLTDRAIDFMKAHQTQPFYLQLSHYAVHSPSQSLAGSRETFRSFPVGERHQDVEMAAMTWDLDTSIGMLLDAIDELDLADHTIVVFMSDNGGPATPRNPQNLPLNGGKGNFYEGGIRVPLIVRGPGIEAGSFCRVPVIGYDLLPTFSEYAGRSIGESIDGVSLVPLLTGSGTFSRLEPLLFHYPHYGQGPRQKPQSAIIEGDYKLIHDFETGNVQLFDLEQDWREEYDLSKEMPEMTQELAAQMSRRLKELEVQMPMDNPDYDPTVSPERRSPRAR
ncbi:sulfatase [Kiritimatiellota bacterium B12222]|nr:sulfatase [Kiritimatiellota bacterium B12222]